jgi:mannose-6-phosphate isomerase-like protein (cupin superfamily)
MKRLILFALVLSGAVGTEGRQGPRDGDGAPAGFVLWRSDRIEAAGDALEQKIGTQRLVFETIGNYPGHSVYLVLRGATGDAELHETEADLFVARRGRATLVIGGELVDARALPRKQHRGSAIRGGVTRELAPGDVAHIPPGVPHQLLIAPGERFLYDLIKFDEEPLAARR